MSDDSSGLPGPVGRVSLTDQVYHLLVTQLMQGVQAPGERLNIEKLAREMDLSPTPIREALARLEDSGLVTRTSLRGYRVAPLMTADDIEHLMEARALLEPKLASMATLARTPRFLQALEQSLAEMKPQSDTDDVTQIRRSWAADETFHTLIAEHSNNPFLFRAYTSLGGHLRRFRLITEARTRTSVDAVDEHRRIYDAISAGDDVAAAELMLRHITNSRRRMLADESASKR